MILLSRLGLMELGGELLSGPLAQGLFQGAAGIAAACAAESLGVSRQLHPILAVRGRLSG